jgi:ABC-type nitrate/sulfonate/bicarbonate transport system permease component
MKWFETWDIPLNTKIKANPNIVSLIILVILLTAWELASRGGLISAAFFPAPSRIADAFIKLLLNGKLLLAIEATFIRFFAGVFLGALVAVILGLMMGWWKKLNYFLSPWISALYPIPKIAIFPLLMILFGIGEGSKFVAIFLASFFPMLISTLAGVQQINRIYFEVGQNYGVRGRKILTHILLPGSLPSILAGLRLAVNSGFVLTISVEVLSAKKGLGVLLWFGWQTFRVSELYAVLVIIALVGIALNYLINQITTRLVPWMGE